VIDADHRSAHPKVRGVPWWGAVLIAVTATAIGFAYDAGTGNKELGFVFGASYVIGCVGAVLAVRRSGTFTAVVQPPLILFISVPGAYFLFHGAKMTGLKDILINCGYPLIERFLLMAATSAVVLLVGMVRWSLSGKRSAIESSGDAEERGGWLASLGEKVARLFSRPSDEEDEEEEEPLLTRRHRPSTAAAGAGLRGAGAPSRTAPSRSRHARPPVTEIIEPVMERPRRNAPRDRHSDRRGAYSDRYERPGRYERAERFERPDRYDRYDRYERPNPYERRAVSERREPYDLPPRRRPDTNGSYTNNTHHPISRVRYRGSSEDHDIQDIQQPRGGRRSRSREPETWEYDI
jgi:hypothetical protein